MKKFLLVFCISLILVEAAAQKKPAPKSTGKPVASQPAMKNSLDSFSYAVGMSVALQYKDFGVTDLNTTIVMKAIGDVLKNKKVAFTHDQANFVLNNFINQQMAKKAMQNKKAGTAFLEANKKKPGVITLPSGLQYLVLKEGTGPKPVATDTVTVHYHGTLTDGRVFDSSVDRGEPATFSVGGVISGWTEALQLMSVGSRWRLFIPADLGYGNYSPPGSIIPPGGTLIFDVELLGISGK